LQQRRPQSKSLILLSLLLWCHSAICRDRVILCACATKYAFKNGVRDWAQPLENTLTIISENLRQIPEGSEDKLVVYVNDLEVPSDAIEYLNLKYAGRVIAKPLAGDISKIRLPYVDAAYLTHPDSQLSPRLRSVINRLRGQSGEVIVDTDLFAGEVKQYFAIQRETPGIAYDEGRFAPTASTRLTIAGSVPNLEEKMRTAPSPTTYQRISDFIQRCAPILSGL